MNLKPLFYFLFLFYAIAIGQKDPAFQNEVSAIQAKYDTIWDSNQETIVFTGSSSIRMWKSLEAVFPGHQIVNSGFGGSQATDLLRYEKELIHRFNPKKVFIYEGDNDIVAGKRPKEIIATTQQIISNLKKNDPNVEIILIAAKPSISRWHLKRKYKRLNRQFQRLARNEAGVEYADVWSIMVDGNQVKQDLFIEDGLHMNQKGYNLWFSVIAPFIDTKNTASRD